MMRNSQKSDRDDRRPQELPTGTDCALTPPCEARTDPDRGTGELGTENLDPSQPLREAGEEK